MSIDPYAAQERQRQREAAHRRRQQSQLEDLREAARLLIPDHGLTVTLAQLAVQARLSRRIAAGLVLGVAELAVDIVCRAWRALIEATAPVPGDTTVDFLARLIEALRADAPAHHVWHAIHCGMPPRHRQTLADAEAFLALAIGEALRELCPGLLCPDLPTCPDLPGASAVLGGRVLAFARHAAHAASTPDSRAEASVIAAILPQLCAPPAAVVPALPAAAPSAARPRPVERPAGPRQRPAPPLAVPSPPNPPPDLHQPAEHPPAEHPPANHAPANHAPANHSPASHSPVWSKPLKRGQDPPARAA